MKRLVHVPLYLYIDEKIPEEALELAKETQLPVRIGSEEDSETDICVVQIPEKHAIDYKKIVEVGFIQPIDYTNEFIVFPKDLKCTVIQDGDPSIQIELTPRLKESHVVKYRDRFNKVGTYNFVLSSLSHGIIQEGKFEVV
jgi:hypothetical protein